MTLYQFVVNNFAALLLGALIGFERQWRQRTAGLRTNSYSGPFTHRQSKPQTISCVFGSDLYNHRTQPRANRQAACVSSGKKHSPYASML